MNYPLPSSFALSALSPPLLPRPVCPVAAQITTDTRVVTPFLTKLVDNTMQSPGYFHHHDGCTWEWQLVRSTYTIMVYDDPCVCL